MIENVLDRVAAELSKQEVTDGDLRDIIVRSPTGQLAVTGQMFLERLFDAHLELPMAIEGHLEGAA